MTIDAFARQLNLDSPAPLALASEEQLYMQGFLLGLRNEQARQAGVPTLPASAPFAPENRLLVNGLLAGLFSRAA